MRPHHEARWLSVASRANSLVYQSVKLKHFEALKRHDDGKISCDTHERHVLQIHKDWEKRSESENYFVDDLRAIAAYRLSLKKITDELNLALEKCTSNLHESILELSAKQGQSKLLEKARRREQLAYQSALASADFTEAESVWIALSVSNELADTKTQVEGRDEYTD